MTRPLRVALDAQLVSGLWGGVESVVIGLAHGLSSLTGGDEEYVFLTYRDADSWLHPYVGGPCRIVPSTVAPSQRLSQTKDVVGRSAPWARPAWRRIASLRGKRGLSVARTDGTAERVGADLVHFPHQAGYLTELPTIYHPHDLQHVHLPEFFSPRERAARDILYGALCRDASMVAAVSTWVQRDVIDHFGLDDDCVRIVPLAPILDAYPDPSPADIAATRVRLGLPDEFAYYPAQTFPHKNHLGLLDALALLRDRHGLVIPLVSSGRLTHFFDEIAKRVETLGLASQTRFLGFVSPADVQVLHKTCRAIVIPTKFEATSMPLWDAFLAGVPAACSNVTSLPAQAGDAALLFDPYRPEEIADALRRLWTRVELRSTLVRRGHANIARFSWERTAVLFRAHYRRIAGRDLSDEDRALIAAPPLL